MQCIVVRDCCTPGNILHRPPLLSVDAARAQALVDGKPYQSPHLVFLQVSEPSRSFGPYDQAHNRLVMTGTNYLRLLDFFATEWDRVFQKLQHEGHAMRDSRDFIRIDTNLFFVGQGSASYQRPLDERLSLVV